VLPESFVFIFPEVSVWMLPGWGTTQTILPTAPALCCAWPRTYRWPRRNRSFVALPRLAAIHSRRWIIPSRAHQGVKLYLFFTVLSLFGGIALGSSRLAAPRLANSKLSSVIPFVWGSSP